MVKTIVIILATCFTLAACNTVRGVGEDVERGGEAIQEAAESAS